MSKTKRTTTFKQEPFGEFTIIFKVASDQKLAPEDEEATSGLRVDIEDSQRNLWSNQNH